MPRENKTKKRVTIKETEPVATVNIESLKHLPPELLKAIVPLSVGMIKHFQKNLTDVLNYLDKGIGDKSIIKDQLIINLDALSDIDRRLNNGKCDIRNSGPIVPLHKSVVSAIQKRGNINGR